MANPYNPRIVAAALLGLGMRTIKESSRWHTQNGRHEEAWESLKWARANDSGQVAAEMEEIRTVVEIEAREIGGSFLVKGTTAAAPASSMRIG